LDPVARRGVTVRALRDAAAPFQDRPEKVDQFWTDAETWGDE
jgi:hypothetical protein